MSDLRACCHCGEEFDYDTEGFRSDATGAFYCSTDCGKDCCGKRGVHYAIHDDDDHIVDTDATEDELFHERRHDN